MKYSIKIFTLILCFIVLLPFFSVSQQINNYDIEQLRSQRSQAASRQRRIILNNDGNDRPGRVITPESFLASRTLGLEKTQVDSIFYCTGIFNVYTHASEVSELTQLERKQWAHQLIEQGKDSLSIMVDWAKENDIEIFWSMRMNDSHDSGNADLMSEWKRQHPEYMIGKRGDFFPHGNFRWSSLNYELEAVREKALAILTDICSCYDIDGIELDFCRHPIYFEETMIGKEATQPQRDLMSTFVRQVREMTEEQGLKRGRPILVSIRVPDCLDYCSALGLHVSKWLEWSWVDIITTGDYFRLKPWQNIVEVGKKYNVPVYACLESRRLVEQEKRSDAEFVLKAFRGEAYNALKAGVSGIYLFNQFNPANPMLNEIGDIETLRNVEKFDQESYVQQIWSRPEVWLATATKYFEGIDTVNNPDTIVNENLSPYRYRMAHFYNRRIIYNNDGNENLVGLDITPQSFLDNRTTGLEETQVDSIFYCTGLTVSHTHHTKIADRFGYNNLGCERKSFPFELDKFGVDSLTLQIEFARKHRKEIFWSLRMNDSHDSSLAADSLRPTWKCLNPDALMGKPGESFPVGGGRWSSLNYANPKVRNHIFSIIKEVCLNYDIDGIELDFFRHPIFFKEVMLGNNASPQSVRIMTDFIRDIRRMTEDVSLQRGRPLIIAIRVPDSLNYCRAIGLDVKTWLDEQLIDILVGGGYFKLEPWENLVKIGKQYDIPVYAFHEARAIVPREYMDDYDYRIKRFRGSALAAWNAGVDGIYTFNLWFSQGGNWEQLYHEIGDPEILKGLERIDGESFVFDYVMPPQRWLKNGERFIRKGRLNGE